MKSTFFTLSNPTLHREDTEHGFGREYAKYNVSVLPAYAMLSYTIQGMRADLDGTHVGIESAIVDDTVIIYGVNQVTRYLTPSDPTLVIYYLGIRDYQKFFPHFDKQSLRERAAQFLEEADKTFEESSWLAFSMMAGAVFESLLLDVVDDNDATFGRLINRAKDMDVFDSLELSALEIAKEARNMIHAGRHGDPYLTREKAMTVRLVLEQFLRKNWAEIKGK